MGEESTKNFQVVWVKNFTLYFCWLTYLCCLLCFKYRICGFFWIISRNSGYHSHYRTDYHWNDYYCLPCPGGTVDKGFIYFDYFYSNSANRGEHSESNFNQKIYRDSGSFGNNCFNNWRSHHCDNFP